MEDIFMIYKDRLVNMPKKKIIYRQSPNGNGTIYVYYTVKAFRNESGKPTSKVEAIGKLDKKTGKLIPNSHYFELFPDKSSVKAIDSSTARTMTVGAPTVMYEISKQIKLLAILQKCFPARWDKLLATAFYMLSESNVMMYISDWFDMTKVDFTDKMSDVECSRLFASITDSERQSFFKEWAKHRKEQEYIAYDVTSISSYSHNIDIVEKGYNRDHEKLPQINFGVFSGITSGLPVYYHIYNGSVPDKSCLKYMMMNAGDIGINNACFVMDRGFETADNYQFMYENDYSFITAMTSKRIEATKLIDKHKRTIEKSQNWINKYKVFAVKESISMDGQKLYAHIYFDLQRKAQEAAEVYSHIEKLDKELETINNKKYVTQRFTEYFTIKEHSKNKITYNLIADKVDEQVSRCGYFILLTNKPTLKSIDILEIYRNKDVIEKNFDQFKNELDFKRLKTHHISTTEGKMFVGFLALILRCYMLQTIKNKSEKDTMTFEKVMLELKKINSISLSNGQEILTTLTKTQKEILAWFRTNEKNLQTYKN
jgi:transposase